MLYFHQQGLAFLEVPKTGSSAIVNTLRHDASLVVRRPPHLRHMNVGMFNGRTRGYLQGLWRKPIETMAVMREPVDRLVSWYRYLQRNPVPDAPDSTDGISFDDFVIAVLDGDPRFEGIGRQDRFLMGNGKVPLVNHLFAYDRQDVLLDFLSKRFKREITFERVNVSQAAPVPVSDDIRDAVRKARPRETKLWAALSQEGYLYAPGA